MDDKVRENRLRRVAERRGLTLRKSRRRDPRALDYGMYALVDTFRNVIVAGAGSGRFDFTLDDVEAFLFDGTDAVAKLERVGHPVTVADLVRRHSPVTELESSHTPATRLEPRKHTRKGENDNG